jgi:hypothetical protein
MNEQTPARTRRAGRNLIQLAVWTLVWLASLAIARFGSQYVWHFQPVLSWTVIGGSAGLGIIWVVVHARYLRGLDELQRKIMLDAIAVALGVGLVGGFAYAVASGAHLIANVDNIGFLSILMAIVYLVATVVGNLRYR